jgi:2-oxoglutarate dehydrogenase complex dehydrogenase (E1) component-like enzyme
MYNSIIPNHIKTFQLYKNKLLSAGVITEEEYQSVVDTIIQSCEAEYEASKTYVSRAIDWKTSYTDLNSEGIHFNTFFY